MDRAGSGGGGQALLAAHPAVDLVLCDDGLHYRLARDVEIAVFDGRGAGNGWPLPAGPCANPLPGWPRWTPWSSMAGGTAWVVEAAAGIDHFDMALRPGLLPPGDPGSPGRRLADLAGRPARPGRGSAIRALLPPWPTSAWIHRPSLSLIIMLRRWPTWPSRWDESC